VFYFGKEIEKRHFNSCVKFLEKKWLKIASVRHGFNFTRTYKNGYLIKGDVERRNRGGLEVILNFISQFNSEKNYINSFSILSALHLRMNEEPQTPSEYTFYESYKS